MGVRHRQAQNNFAVFGTSERKRLRRPVGKLSERCMPILTRSKYGFHLVYMMVRPDAERSCLISENDLALPPEI